MRASAWGWRECPLVKLRPTRQTAHFLQMLLPWLERRSSSGAANRGAGASLRRVLLEGESLGAEQDGSPDDDTAQEGSGVSFGNLCSMVGSVGGPHVRA